MKLEDMIMPFIWTVFVICLLAIALPYAANAQETGWYYEERQDEMTDAMQQWAAIVEDWNSSRSGFLAVYCWPDHGNFEVRVSSGDFLNSGGERIKLYWRIDKDEITSGTWIVQPNHVVAYRTAEIASRFARTLLGREQIIFELVAHDDEAHRVKFTLEGADEHVLRVLESCGETPEQVEIKRELAQERAEEQRKERERQAAERNRKFEEKMRRMREETERLKRERGATYGTPEAEPEQSARERAEELRKLRERQAAERNRKFEEKMRRMREETERLKRERGATYGTPEAEPEQSARPRSKREAVDQTGKVLDDTGAATPPAPSSQATTAPAARSEAPQERPGDAGADNPLEAVGAFALDSLGLLTGNIEIKEGGSERLRP